MLALLIVAALSVAGASDTGSHYVPVILNGSATVSVRRLTEVPVEEPRAQKLARRLEERFREIRDAELGVPDIQEMFDLMEFAPVVREDVDTVKRMSQRLAEKMEKAHLVIENLREFILAKAQELNRSRLNSVTFPCPFRAPSIHYDRQQIEIVNFMKTVEDVQEEEVDFEDALTEELKKFSHTTAHFKRQFFLASDNAVDSNCPDNPHLRTLFTAAIESKRLLLLVDHGSSLNMDQLELTKAAAKSVISLLHGSDSVSVVSVSDRVGVFSACSPGQMHTATLDNRMRIMRFLDGLNKTKAQTNHTLGFEFAFKLLKEIEPVASQGQFMFLYVSRGLLSSLADATAVLEVIAAGQKRLARPVAINTIQVVLDEKRIMYETQFLWDITVQDYRKHKIEGVEDSEPGEMLSVNKYKIDEVYVNVTALFAKMFREGRLQDNITVHQPYLDPDSRDILVSVTQTCDRFGVFGVDLYLNDLAEDVLYYSKYPDSYAFITDLDGHVISHPSFADRASAVETIFPTDISLIEPLPFGAAIRSEMLQEIFGAHSLRDEATNDTVTFTWHHVMESYVICVVTRVGEVNRSPVTLKRVHQGIHYYAQHHNEVSMAGLTDIVYHRLDLLPPAGKTMCRHFKQIATMDCGTLFLSPGAFQSPFVFVRNSRESSSKATIHSIQTLMAYIKDKTSLLANPGLLPAVRNDVAALTHIIGYLKKRHLREGPLKNFIIRRYVASINGVLLVYPGSQVNNQLEVSQRAWFARAMAYPGRIVVTEPYLDAGGAGYVITVAHTIFEGKPNALHNAQRDTPIGVVALDLTMGFHYKLLLESGAFCTEANVKCFLMEDRGYLIAHPSVLEPATGGGGSRRPLEHITHRESFVANDILNHKELVQKKLCNVYANRTIQRYYQFNISLTDVLTNVVHGERTKYQISVVPGTNIFVGVLNASNDGGAFCPCSTVDRLCLNCNRMEQTECECPCECPLHYESSSEGPKCSLSGEEDQQQQLGVCAPFMPEAAPASVLTYSVDDLELRACVGVVCDLYATQTECLGVVGCEWCQVDVDGETIFTQPFCTSMQSCFNGILGSATPYGDGQLGSTIVDPLIPPAYSAIGPVAGATIALCLVVGFAMYCYRQNQDPGGAEHLYGGDSQGENQLDVPMARLNFDDMTHDDGDLGNSSNQNLLPATGIMIPEVSPYRAPSVCRRPNAADSDHGYSTMTPHEDSENLCFTLADPLLTHKRLSMSDSASISTSVSSPTNCRPLALERHLTPQEGTTVLPASPHLVLAPVTVHRQMEATTS